MSLTEVDVPLEIENAVLDLVSEVTGCPIQRKTAPDWLMRPGRTECGKRWPLVCRIYRELTGLKLPEVMPEKEWRKVDGVMFCPNPAPRIVEVDESQHFNCHRGITLRLYPTELRLAFDCKTWTDHSKDEPRQKSGGWAKPKPPLFPDPGGRHLQRAFRDALADILPPDYGFLPTLRIADFEVEPWIGTAGARTHMADLLKRKFKSGTVPNCCVS